MLRPRLLCKCGRWHRPRNSSVIVCLQCRNEEARERTAIFAVCPICGHTSHGIEAVLASCAGPEHLTVASLQQVINNG